MTVPDPHQGRRPTTGMDPMPSSAPVPPLGDDIPDPSRPGQTPRRPGPEPDGRLTLMATGREDRRRHLVDVQSG